MKYFTLMVFLLAFSARGEDEIILSARSSESFINLYSEISKAYPNLDLVAFGSTKSESVGFVKLDKKGEFAFFVNPSIVRRLIFYKESGRVEVKFVVMKFKRYGFLITHDETKENKNLVLEDSIGISFPIEKEIIGIEIIASSDEAMALRMKGLINKSGDWSWEIAPENFAEALRNIGEKD